MGKELDFLIEYRNSFLIRTRCDGKEHTKNILATNFSFVIDRFQKLEMVWDICKRHKNIDFALIKVSSDYKTYTDITIATKEPEDYKDMVNETDFITLKEML